MFWKGKVSFIDTLTAFVKGSDVSLADHIPPPVLPLIQTSRHGCFVSVAALTDTDQIAALLNKYFDSGKAQTAVTSAWVRNSFLELSAIWIVAKDKLGTVRGCISSFRSNAPYPNSLGGCGTHPWGLVDWYCVEPLWRSKGLGTDLLETLDFITYRVGRKAHIFLKEGLPLPFTLPIYCTVLYCRKAGNPDVKQMSKYTGLSVYPYNAVERESGLPLVRVEGVDTDVEEWENALNSELPPCWVFVNGSSKINMKEGWKQDTLVSVYAFRWIPGKWLGSQIKAH